MRMLRKGSSVQAFLCEKEERQLKIKLPASVKMVIDSLEARGYEAYAVGGCIRDSILGRVPDDWDITTSATPYEVKNVFQRTVDTGLKHGTVTVLAGSHAHEVTTYRIDGEYEDSRHPKSVEFTRNLEEDLRRRDFTINAMAYNDHAGLVDLYGGMRDLQRKEIRCVGNAEERFQEDALRILRAFRFSAQLGFEIEEETEKAAAKLAATLDRISEERIAVELTKLLLSDRPGYLRRAWETGITAVILPEFDRMMETEQNNPHHCRNVGEHTLESLSHVPAERVLRWTMLLHDIGKPFCRTTDENGVDHFRGHGKAGVELTGKILRRLKFDNDTIRQAMVLVRWHDCRMRPEERVVRRIMNRISPELFEKLMQVQYADTMAQSLYRREEKLERIRKVQETGRKILEEKQCISQKDLKLNGRDLLAMGVKPGPMMGEILKAALREVLDEPARNDAVILKRFAKGYLEMNGRKESGHE